MHRLYFWIVGPCSQTEKGAGQGKKEPQPGRNSCPDVWHWTYLIQSGLNRIYDDRHWHFFVCEVFECAALRAFHGRIQSSLPCQHNDFNEFMVLFENFENLSAIGSRYPQVQHRHIAWPLRWPRLSCLPSLRRSPCWETGMQAGSSLSLIQRKAWPKIIVRVLDPADKSDASTMLG